MVSQVHSLVFFLLYQYNTHSFKKKKSNAKNDTVLYI
jgi:hypothetical protein